MQNLAERLPSPLAVLRVVLAGFVLAWIFGPYALRAAVPIWLVFLIAVGLEVQFFVSGLGQVSVRRPDRGPQAVDRERYGTSARPMICYSSAREGSSSGSRTQAREAKSSRR